MWERQATAWLIWPFIATREIGSRWPERIRLSVAFPVAAEGKTRGAMIYGTAGSALLDGEAYVLYDQKGKVTREVKNFHPIDATNTLSSTGVSVDVAHFKNFADAIRNGARLNAPVADANTSVTLAPRQHCAAIPPTDTSLTMSMR